MLRPSVKREHVPLILPDGRIRLGLGQYGVATEIDDEDGAVVRLLSLLDGSRDVAATSCAGTRRSTCAGCPGPEPG